MKTGQLSQAFQIVEQSTAKVLIEKLAHEDLNQSIPKIEDVQNQISSKELLLIYSNSGADDLVQISISNENVKGIIIDKKDFIKWARNQYGSEIDQSWAEQQKFARKIVDNDNLFALKESDLEFKKIIYYYRSLLEKGQESKFMSRELYKLLIEPMEEELKCKSELVISPDSILYYIPFEMLIDKDGALKEIQARQPEYKGGADKLPDNVVKLHDNEIVLNGKDYVIAWPDGR